MFGMGFAEILIIAVIAILFLGPEKLPKTMIEIARFFRSAKQSLASAKSSIEQELHVEDIKREVDSYKSNLLDSKAQLESQVKMTELTDEFDAVVQISDPKPQAATPVAEPSAAKPEVVTFAKKKTASSEPSDNGKDA